MAHLLEVIDLVKQYRTVTAVAGVSFTIPPGICFGLLGPNGAGKTTALEVIEDIIPATSGTILYKGEPRFSSFREEVGIQFQHTALLNFLSVRETIETFRTMYRQPADLHELVSACNLGDILDKRNDRISGGQGQRLTLALALVNRPELLFLDEPSTGLDPQARRNLWEIVRNVKAEGKTIVLTTHSMEEAEYLCDQIAIMDHGRIIAQGSPRQLVDRHCRGATLILPRQAVKQHTLPLEASQNGDRLEIRVESVNDGIRQLMAAGIDLGGMSVHTPNLEDVFLTLTGRQLRD